MQTRPADWQLPKGVDRHLWDYCRDARLARSYDESLRDCRLLQVDQSFVDRHCLAPGRVIDLGCGTGRTAVAMASNGLEVVAVDLSEEMLKLVGEKANAAGITVHRLRANVVELDGIGDETFDYAVCMFSTLGMIHGAEARQLMIDQAYRLLRPGGKFLLHVHNRWFNFWDPEGRKWLIKDVFHRANHAGDRQMPAHDGQGKLTLHLFTRKEICRMLRRPGFRIVEVCPVSLRKDGRVRHPWFFGWLRAYGYLIAVEKNATPKD